MSPDIPKYPRLEDKKKPEDAIARSIAKPNAFAKPGHISKTNMRVRLTSGDKSLKPRKRNRRDPRDVIFY